MNIITFDKKTKIYLLGLTLLFIIGVWGKYHTSNIVIWHQIFGDNYKAKKSILFGEAQFIRTDEWLVSSLYSISQTETNLSSKNASFGPLNTPLVMGLPVRHISSYLKVYNWGYYFLDNERAFSFYWLTKYLLFLTSFFLLLKILTNNNFWLSVFGTFWLFMSSMVQWWSIWVELTYGMAFIVISFLYILYSKKRLLVILNGIILSISLITFSLTLYPPLQIPQIYIGILITLAFLIKNKPLPYIKNNVYVKSITLLGVASCFVFVVFSFFNDAKEVIEIVTNTVYPGKRMSVGGDMDFVKFFFEYFFYFYHPENFPKWGNICESSGILLFFPAIIIMSIINFYYSKKVNVYLLFLIPYIIFLTIYMFIGIPPIISKITLFNMVPAVRAFFSLGIVNIILVVVFLSSYKENAPSISSKSSFMISSSVISFILILVYGIFINGKLNNFFSFESIIITSLYFGLAYGLICSNYLKYRIAIFCSMILLFLIPNLKANPLSSGLGSIIKNPFYKTVKNIHNQDSEGKWIVFGQYLLSNFIKTTGANVLSGANYAPDMNKMRVLDPHGKNDSIYNRYAHINFYPFIDGTDSTIFKLAAGDNYAVQMDPCSPKLKTLGVKYFVFGYIPQPVETRCLTLIDQSNGFPIYKRND